MAKFVVRRHAEPVYVRGLIEAVTKIASQKQCPNEERILRAVQLEYEWTQTDVLKQLKLAVKDGFFTQVTAISSHGSTKGIPQTAFRVCQSDSVKEEKPLATSDWYCWACHGAGEIIQCNHCPRVFHRKCARDGSVSGGKWKCPSCQPSKLPTLINTKSVDELAKMLLYTMDRMKEKAKSFLSSVDLDEYDDYLDYVFKPMDLSLLEEYVKEKRFKTPKEFREEAQWILHNSTIYFGDDTDMTDLAEAIMEDCDGELEELIRCPDCYLMSNLRTDNWFSKPCFYPHELVWAKMTGEPPWPSKLLEWNEEMSKALVRFFGSAHQRAWVIKKNISPITQKPDVKKRPQRWLQAVDEMKLYQRQLDQLENRTMSKKLPTSKSNDSYDENSMQADILYDENCNCGERSGNSEMQQKINELNRKLDDEIKKNAEIIKRKDERIKILQDHAKTLEDHLNSAVLNLEGERNRAKEYKQRLDKLESMGNLDGTSNHVISNGSPAVEPELHGSRDLSSTVCSGSSKPRERKNLDEVKRTVNKERLEREKAIADALKKAKKDHERQVQRTLQNTREDGERSIKEAVSLTKRKQWCAYCSNEAFYPCCWNTSYCTVDCQKSDWCSHRYHCMRLACNCGRNCTKSC